MKDINATIIINLEGKNQEEIWRNVKYTRRKYVQQAQKSGLYYEKSEKSEINLKEMYEMNMDTFKEGGIAVWTYEKWKDFVSPAGDKFFFVKIDKEKVGCFVLTEITKEFYKSGLKIGNKGIRPLVFATKKKFNNYRPNDYLYWITIKYSLDNKYDFVDLGGWQIKARGHVKNINSFKEEWGGEIQYYYWDYPILTAIRRKLIRNFTFFWHINNFLKKFWKRRYSVHDKYVKDATARN
ncbi:MAG: hypothetical protein AABW91_03480 [Nanoarchaeota archaeon]